ncbi:MAG: RecX family transcriptional regulator [Alphaproteobacteria bacterium]|nr:RecX family transcriptional regulator [Alphaproteobacteria bacterium]
MQKPLTQKRLENITLYYLERFDASSGKVRQMLKRRVQKQKLAGIPLDKNMNQWIETTIQKMQDLGYVNDEHYVENVIRRLSQSGKSTRFITQKLLAEGIDEILLEKYLSPEDELERARTFARKKHLGSDYQKDLAKLARAGFPYEVAIQVLKGEDDV